jgi:hypothetical protein
VLQTRRIRTTTLVLVTENAGIEDDEDMALKAGKTNTEEVASGEREDETFVEAFHSNNIIKPPNKYKILCVG